MNQQLQQLAEKAGIKLTNGSYSLKVQADEGSLTEFAELIVRECAKEVVASHKFGNDMAKKVVKDAAKSAKKHFGIK